METRSQNRGMKPQGTLPSAPSGEPGADFKTASWGGSNDGRAGAALARPEGPMGPRIAASAASDVSNAYAASNGSNASNGMRLVLPDGSVLEVPGGLSAKIDRWGGVVYRVGGEGAILRLAAELLFRVSRSKGSIVYLNTRKIATLLGLRNGHLDAFSSSWIRYILAQLGFEVVETNRGKAVVMRTDHPLIKELRGVRSIDDAVEIVKRYLGE